MPKVRFGLAEIRTALAETAKFTGFVFVPWIGTVIVDCTPDAEKVIVQELPGDKDEGQVLELT
ncbi:hypothetical protein B6N58_00235 [Legionella micdadei]|nr:hypothetical protein B6N58_00235 [Legionella micdadei]